MSLIESLAPAATLLADLRQVIVVLAIAVLLPAIVMRVAGGGARLQQAQALRENISQLSRTAYPDNPSRIFCDVVKQLQKDIDASRFLNSTDCWAAVQPALDLLPAVDDDECSVSIPADQLFRLWSAGHCFASRDRGHGLVYMLWVSLGMSKAERSKLQELGSVHSMVELSSAVRLWHLIAACHVAAAVSSHSCRCC